MSITRRFRFIVALAVVAAGLVGVSQASAAACTTGSSQVFLQFGDVSFYDLMQNGGFESGTTGWTMSGGAQVANGNDPYFLNKKKDSHDASLPAGSSITSDPFCVSVKTPYARFMNVGGSRDSNLRVDVICGSGPPVTVATFRAFQLWLPSPQISMLPCVPGTLLGQTAMVQLRVTAIGGSAQVDDFFLDPFKGK
jgi:hypothetical protein